MRWLNDVARGCSTANTAACDDGDGCTANDQCAGGSCTSGAPKDCNDGNPCTMDVCGSGMCSYTLLPNGSPCGPAETCQFGACM